MEALSKMIFKLAEDENGKSSFIKLSDVYDFIYDCKAERIIISKLYAKIAEALNDEFFSKRK